MTPAATSAQNCNLTVCASNIIYKSGACSLSCAFSYTASGTATALGPVTGVLSFTGGPTKVCNGINSCGEWSVDPTTYPTAVCHTATMVATSVVTAQDTHTVC